MNLEEIKDFFGTFKNAMRKAGLSENAYLAWRRNGRIPYHSQRKIAEASKGYLQADNKEGNRYAESKKGYNPVTGRQANERYAKQRAVNA